MSVTLGDVSWVVAVAGRNMRRAHRLTAALFIILVLVLVFRDSDRMSTTSKSTISAAPTDLGRKSEHDGEVEPSVTSSPVVPITTFTPAAEKAIVMGKLSKEDTSWVHEELPDWETHIYTVDNQSASLHTAVNKGREAMPYLTFIIDRYRNLPKTIAFLHSHRGGFPEAWHNDAPDYLAKNMLDRLKIDYVQESGYVNLRCIHIPGCPDEVQMFRNPPEGHRTVEHNMLGPWQLFFNGTEPPPVIAAPCCAQFAVSRNQVLKRPLDDYEMYRKWLLETPLDDDTSGRIFEYLWHVIFGKEPVFCPDIEECWCKVFDRCDEHIIYPE